MNKEKLQNIIMNFRVLGCLGIGVINGSPNNGWDNQPNRLDDGTYINSSFSTCYALKIQAEQDGHKVHGLSSTDDKGKLRNVDNRFSYLFGIDEKNFKNETDKTIHEKMITTFDGKHRGYTLAGKIKSQEIGVVQMHHGKNIYSDTNKKTINVLSPFQNLNKSESKQSSGGEKTFLDEAHFIQQFSVNPFNNTYNDYTIKDYQQFKEISLKAITNLDTTQKSGCFNEFGLFIELKEKMSMNYPNLTKAITIEKDNDKTIYNLEKLEILNECDKINNIEIYYNPIEIEVKHKFTDKIKLFNIISMKPIK